MDSLLKNEKSALFIQPHVVINLCDFQKEMLVIQSPFTFIASFLHLVKVNGD